MKLYLIAILLILSGCAASVAVKDKAASIMGNSKCYQMFVDNGFSSYQHCTHQFSPNCVFALAFKDKAIQSCGFSRKWELSDKFCVVDCSATTTQIEALAVSRCEEAKAGIRELSDVPCKVFARNNDIVWERYKSDEMQFQ